MVDSTFVDSRRGLTSYGARALGGGSCYDPRPDPAPGTRCQYEQVLRQLPVVWPDARASAWTRTDDSASESRVVGVVDPIVGDSPLQVSGWVVDTACPDGSGVDGVDVYLATPGQTARLLTSGSASISRADVADSLDNPDCADAGFQIDVPTDALPIGVANLTLVAHTSDGGTWSRSLAAIVAGSPQPTPPPILQPIQQPIQQPILQAPPPRLQVTSPTPGATVGSGQVVEGFASDPSASVGSGIDRVEIFLQPGRDAGGKLLGAATLGRPVPDAFAFVLRPPRGTQTLYIYAHSAVTGRETLVTLPVRIL